VAKTVKPRDPSRPYRSPLRADQARETRRRIRDAADALFLQHGYVPTSMDDIARAAGVSRQTVFTAFGSKANLLKEAFDVRLAGDDEPVSLAERPEAQRILAETDPAALLRAQADFYIVTTLRVLPLWPAMVAGAATDPACAEVLAFLDRGRFEGPGAIVDVLAERGQLRTGLSPDRGKEAMYLLTNPNVTHDALERGWTVAELQRWLGDCLVAVLLDQDTRARNFDSSGTSSSG
jgi:AcrR family transcriptional regulator